MKCFVTGATGHIGNVLVRKLYEDGHKMTSLVLPKDDISMIEPYTEIIRGNILDTEFLEDVVKNYDWVFHLAGIVEIGTGRKRKIYTVNVEGTRNILSACQKNHIKRLIYTSSVHAVEELPKGQAMKEVDVFDPLLVKGHYAKSKAIATNIILNQEDDGLETIVVCPSGVIGPYDFQLSNTGQVFIDYMLGRLTAYVGGSYNFVDVRDVAAGIIIAAKIGKDKNSYLLSGDNITVKELLDTIAEFSGKKKIKTRLAYWFILAMSYFAELYYKIMKQKPLFTHYSVKVLHSNHLFDNSKAKKELGFTTRPLKQSIQDTLLFAQEHYLEKRGTKWKKKIME
ncbi:MAG: NAD-dependent epimerase/dehydratase family protein [Bacilli bacterium]|nr:NAD-dependent epimerase/dehydratase family protein [Bacilli bacterium]MBN2877148.1 NAD-dependent epimerase/dehydratase family protein [Bacilli bacterium]